MSQHLNWRRDDWPWNLITDVIGEERSRAIHDDPPEDYKNAFDYALHLLNWRQCIAIEMRYRRHDKLYQIGEQFGVTASTAMNIINEGLRALRAGTKREIIESGVAAIRTLGIEPPKGEPPEDDKLINLDLSVRGYNCIRRMGLRRISELDALIRSDEEWWKLVPCLGRKTADDIEMTLMDYLQRRKEG